MRERPIRDVKPENIILDQEGHAHLTDFNIATVLKTGEVAISVSGTKPYMGKNLYVSIRHVMIKRGGNKNLSPTLSATRIGGLIISRNKLAKK